MADEGWEARMAQRARERAASLPSEAATWHADRLRREREECEQYMTLCEAWQWHAMLREYGPLGCACAGGVWCCVNRSTVGLRLLGVAARFATTARAVVDRG